MITINVGTFHFKNTNLAFDVIPAEKSGEIISSLDLSEDAWSVTPSETNLNRTNLFFSKQV